MASAPGRDRFRLAAQIAFGAYLLSLLIGLLLPIYTDEIGWRMQLRAGIDGGIDGMLSDVCGPNTLAAPPWFMLPHRLITGWLNVTFADPLYIRLVGVACALGWAFLLRAVIARIAPEGRLRQILGLLGFGLLGFGVLPIMMAMSRPDAVVLLCVTGSVFACLKAEAARPWLAAVAIGLLGLVALSAHLKGVLFAPVFLLCLFYAAPHKAMLWRKLLPMLIFLLMALQATHYWVDRFRCPDDPVLSRMLASQNLASVFAGAGDWQDKLSTALGGASPNGYIHSAEAHAKPMSNWLPPGQISSGHTALRKLAMIVCWDLAMLLALWCLLRAVWQSWRERRLDFALALPVGLTGVLLVWSTSQLIKNAYEAMIVLPLLALAMLFALARHNWSEVSLRRLGRGALVVALLSLAMQIDFARRYLPVLAETAARPGYVAAQPHSLSPYGYGALRGTIRAAARQCGIGAKGRAIRPLLDDATYFAFADSYRPFHQVSVIGKWKGGIDDPIAYIARQGSEGAIMGCHNLPAEIRARAIRNGEFCCVSAR